MYAAGCRDVVLGRILKKMFETDYFRCVVVPDADTVEICGALKVVHCFTVETYCTCTLFCYFYFQFLDQELNSYCYSLCSWASCWADPFKKAYSLVMSNQMGMNFGRNFLQVNMHRLI